MTRDEFEALPEEERVIERAGRLTRNIVALVDGTNVDGPGFAIGVTVALHAAILHPEWAQAVVMAYRAAQAAQGLPDDMQLPEALVAITPIGGRNG